MKDHSAQTEMRCLLPTPRSLCSTYIFAGGWIYNLFFQDYFGDVPLLHGTEVSLPAEPSGTSCFARLNGKHFGLKHSGACSLHLAPSR